MSAYLNIRVSIPEWLDKVCVWPLMVYRKMKYGYTFRRIYIDEGQYAIVDPPDYYTYGKYKYILAEDGNNAYAIREAKIGPNKTKIVSLHREIMNAPQGTLVDHINNNGLDDRSANLRFATRSQNNMNRPKRAGTSSQYLNVCFEKCCQLWGGYIRINGKKKRLGRYKTEVEAARAYDCAALKYLDDFARLNFPREDYVKVGNDYKYVGRPAPAKCSE